MSDEKEGSNGNGSENTIRLKMTKDAYEFGATDVGSNGNGSENTISLEMKEGVGEISAMGV